MPQTRTSRRNWNRRIELNIVRNYLAATPEDVDAGLHWYANARAEAEAIAMRYSVSVIEAVGVIAVLSPGLRWGRNVLEAEALIAAWASGNPLPIVGAYGRANVDKARRILSGERPDVVLGGRKVRAFFYNILFPEGEALVTIDRHMKAIAMDTPSERRGYASSESLSAVKSTSEYDYLEWHYRVIAARYGLIPSQFQAVNWTCWKRRNETGDDGPQGDIVQ